MVQIIKETTNKYRLEREGGGVIYLSKADMLDVAQFINMEYYTEDCRQWLQQEISINEDLDNEAVARYKRVLNDAKLLTDMAEWLEQFQEAGNDFTTAVDAAFKEIS